MRILHESPHLLVVSKPAGLATQAPPGVDSVEVRVKRWLVDTRRAEGDVYLGVPHRLDRPVSGALVMARHPKAARRISQQFEKRKVRKIYWACVEKPVEPEKGVWTDYLRKIYGHPRAEVVPADHPDGRLAVLNYWTLAHADWGTWLEIELETGRTHQIRVQCATRGHAVLGDAFYGAAVQFGIQHEDERLRAIALHARSISFRDLASAEIITVTAGVPDAWRALGLRLEA